MAFTDGMSMQLFDLVEYYRCHLSLANSKVAFLPDSLFGFTINTSYTSLYLTESLLNNMYSYFVPLPNKERHLVTTLGSQFLVIPP